jgi:hypothetical protein
MRLLLRTLVERTIRPKNLHTLSAHFDICLQIDLLCVPNPANPHCPSVEALKRRFTTNHHTHSAFHLKYGERETKTCRKKKIYFGRRGQSSARRKTSVQRTSRRICFLWLVRMPIFDIYIINNLGSRICANLHPTRK